MTRPDPQVTGQGSAIVKYAFANIATATTDGAIVTAVSGKRIRVLAVVAINAGTATTITFNSKSGGAGTAISAAFQALNNGPILPYAPVGWFQTNSGEGLTATTSAAGSTFGVQVVYVEV